MLRVWICNSELRHVRIFVTPCSFYVLLQCDGKARCFFGIKMPVGWQNFIENPNCADYVGWSKGQCSFATRDCCLTDRADLTVGPTLTSEKNSNTAINISVYDVLFTNAATKYRHKPRFVAEAPFNEKHNKARTSVDTYHYGLYGKKEKAKHRCRESCDCCQPNDFPINSR